MPRLSLEKAAERTTGKTFRELLEIGFQERWSLEQLADVIGCTTPVLEAKLPPYGFRAKRQRVIDRTL